MSVWLNLRFTIHTEPSRERVKVNHVLVECRVNNNHLRFKA